MRSLRFLSPLLGLLVGAAGLGAAPANGEIVIGPGDSLTDAVMRARSTKEHRVVLRPGLYFLPDGLNLTAVDSGLTLIAQKPGSASLIGGKVVRGWKRQADHGLWRAPRPQGGETSQLFQGGRRLNLARLPKEGYFQTAGTVPGTPTRAFVVKPGDLPTNLDLTDARVFAWQSHNWFTTDKAVSGYDPGTRTLTTTSADGGPFQPGNRYFLYNSLSLLDTPGAAVIGSDAFYLRTTAGRDAPGEIIASTAPALVRYDGARGVTLEGLGLTVAEGNGVEASGGASDCRIRFCRIENSGRDGVHIGPEATQITVYGCEIRETGAMGVSLSGPGLGKGIACGGNTIENCHIHDGGRRQGHGYGVEIANSGENRIVHNDIHDFPRYGVSIKGMRFHAIRAIPANSAPGMTSEKPYDYLPARGNLIAYNDIHAVNRDSQDTGAVESWEPGRDNVIDHNLIHDSGNSSFDIESGIYLDDAADYFTVTNNIIYGIKGTHGNQPIFVKGVHNRIENNILVVDPTNDAAIRSFQMADEPARDEEYRRNIIVFDPVPAALSDEKGRWGEGLSELHPPGTKLTWSVRIPADGDYSLWCYYAAENKSFGNARMDGRTSLTVDSAPPVPLINLPDTGSFSHYAFPDAPNAILHLTKGTHTLVWRNDKGGGLNWDAFVLSTDPAFRPKPADSPDVITVQVEAAKERVPLHSRRDVWWFQNWSDDRLAFSDENLFFSGDGQIAVLRGTDTEDWVSWRRVKAGAYDAHSRIADPGFVSLSGRDFRLQPDSPALSLGFRPINATVIGLEKDFPFWLKP